MPGLILNSWYLNNGALMAQLKMLSTSSSLMALLWSRPRSKSLLWSRPRSKSLLYIPQDDVASTSPLPADIPVTRQGFTLLGCPIGPPSRCGEDKVRLGSIGRPGGFATGDNSAPLVSLLPFTLRSCPPSHICHGVKALDEALRECL